MFLILFNFFLHLTRSTPVDSNTDCSQITCVAFCFWIYNRIFFLRSFCDELLGVACGGFWEKVKSESGFFSVLCKWYLKSVCETEKKVFSAQLLIRFWRLSNMPNGWPKNKTSASVLLRNKLLMRWIKWASSASPDASLSLIQLTKSTLKQIVAFRPPLGNSIKYIKALWPGWKLKEQSSPQKCERINFLFLLNV